MGWIGYAATKFNDDGKVDPVKEISSYLKEYNENVLAIKCVNNVVYTAIASQDHSAKTITRGIVFVTHVEDGIFYFNEICEEMGPFASECPNEILDILSPTNEESAIKWRRRCREFNSKC